MAALDFRGQTVWVTGAGKGIGYATALAFVEAGANVTGFDLAFDGESYPFATETLDVADADQVREACSRLLANTERLDVLVNAAGILSGASHFASMDLQCFLLREEGVEVLWTPKGWKTDLKRYGWKNTMEEALELNRAFFSMNI